MCARCGSLTGALLIHDLLREVKFLYSTFRMISAGKKERKIKKSALDLRHLRISPPHLLTVFIMSSWSTTSHIIPSFVEDVGLWTITGRVRQPASVPSLY